MKYFPIILILTIFSSCQKQTDVELLIDYGSNLNKLTSYEYTFELLSEYSYSGKNPAKKGTAYFEENPDDTLIGYKYYFESEVNNKQFASFFDGNKIVGLRKNDSIAYFKEIHKYKDYKGISSPYFSSSILSIGKWIMTDSLENKISNLKVRDTIISAKKCKLFSFRTTGTLHNWWYWETKTKNNYDIDIAFDIHSKLPVYLKSKCYFKTPDYGVTSVKFTGFVEKRYPEEKMSIERVEDYYKWGLRKTSLSKNTIAPNFTLPNIHGDSVELFSLKDKYILLKFGFIGCGACVKSIPSLNQIEKKYRHTGLKVIGVNLYCDSEEKVRTYYQKNNTEYEMLWSDNNDIATDYKITSAPIFYLIDDTGKILFAQIGYDENSLNNQLEAIFGKL